MQIDIERQKANKALQAVLEPSIAGLDQDLSALVNQRRELDKALALFDEARRLDELERGLDSPPPSTRKSKKSEFSGLPPDAYDNFAKAVEAILRDWSFPELDRVVFDTAAEDVVISGKARKDNGKGYRAITYAAFMIALLQETNRKGLPHPGFIVLDSPLVTYREPEEHIGEGVKFAFYRSLAKNLNVGQVIVLENEEPPADLEAVSLIQFTKNRAVGRYGLFPPLPEK